MPRETVNQPSAMPSRKAVAGALAGMIGTAVMAGLSALATNYPALDFLTTPGITEGVSVLSAVAGFYITKEWAPE